MKCIILCCYDTWYVEPCCNILTTQEIPFRNFPNTPSFEGQPSSNASTSSSRPWTFNTDQYNTRRRTSLFNSGFWISVEFTVTLSQIIASIVVLSLSNLDDLLSLLSIWIIGYATGCLATLPLLYWRYKERYLILGDQDVSAPHESPPTSTTTNESNSYISLTLNAQDEILQSQINNEFNFNENR